MKIQIFHSTAIALSLLREALEEVLKCTVRLGEHEINLLYASDCPTTKMVHVNGIVNARSGDRRPFQVGAAIAIRHSEGIRKEVILAFFISGHGSEDGMHEFNWDPNTDRLARK